MEYGAKGFEEKNLWRMKQFYETYRDNEKLSTLLRDLSWSNNLLIMNRCKTEEEREYQLQLPDKKLLQAKMQELFQHQN